MLRIQNIDNVSPEPLTKSYVSCPSLLRPHLLYLLQHLLTVLQIICKRQHAMEDFFLQVFSLLFDDLSTFNITITSFSFSSISLLQGYSIAKLADF